MRIKMRFLQFIFAHLECCHIDGHPVLNYFTSIQYDTIEDNWRYAKFRGKIKSHLLFSKLNCKNYKNWPHLLVLDVIGCIGAHCTSAYNVCFLSVHQRFFFFFFLMQWALKDIMAMHAFTKNEKIYLTLSVFKIKYISWWVW